jgi:hypothetical protein
MPMEDQLKVIRENVLYTLNEVYRILQVIEQFNERLFSMEERLDVVEADLEAKADAAVKAQLALESQRQRRKEVEHQ